MDESLSDFKEKKDFVHPKKTRKPQKPRRVKRLKGQKDIRTVLKNKNEHLTFSKEFDEICKQSGVDVDSEQLQLAVALSKSLQSDDKPESEVDTSQTSTSQERFGKIRTTLLEYGFKVPDIKIVNTRKKTKKNRKDYKLILLSDKEKEQAIFDKYSQVLFNCLDCKVQNSRSPNKESQLYNICTKVPYSDLNNDLLYVPGLLEQSPNSIGSLLRDWADIPGRPSSPNLSEDTGIIFSEILCSQDELDIILSGTIKFTKDILKKIRIEGNNSEPGRTMKVLPQKSSSCHSKTLVDEEIILVTEHDKNNFSDSQEKDLLTETQRIRSHSPDIFDDDEVSFLNENSADVKFQSKNIKSDSSSIFMDLTNCTPCNNVKIEISQPKSQLSQKYDVTKRKSNDFMEITDCVATLSQPIIVNEIDLTHNESPAIDVKYVNATVKEAEVFDLTQSSPDDLPEVLISGRDKSADDTIILGEDELHIGLEKDVTEAIVDLDSIIHTSSSENVGGHEVKEKENHFEEFLHNHSDDQEEADEKVNRIENANQEIDLSHTESCGNICNNVSDKVLSTDLGKINNVSIDYDDMFDEVVSNVNTVQSTVHDISDDDDTDQNLASKEVASNSSRNCESFEISDNELNYSIQKSKCEHNFEVGGLSVLDNVSLANDSKKSLMRNSVNDESLPFVNVKAAKTDEPSPIKAMISQTPSREKPVLIETPKNEYTIKTENVTPIQDYVSMSTPDRNMELEKYGLKPFKRKRAIQLLTHLYNQTHPIMESMQEQSPSKRPKHESQSPTKPPKSANPSPRKQLKSPKASPQKAKIPFGSMDLFEVTNELPDIKEINCDVEDWVFQKREKAKVHSCRVPLHIAFHNYISCRRRLYEAILRYEPIDIDSVHKGLVGNGFRYDPKDLLKFMDKKCITVKTADNNARNRKS